MDYKGFIIRITADRISRHDNSGAVREYDGFIVEIFAQDCDTPIEVFNAAVGYELLNNDIEEARQLAKDYIEIEIKKEGF